LPLTPEPTALEAALGLLPDRTLWKWKVAHLLLDRTGTYTCLDLNVSAPSVDAIKDAIVVRVQEMKREDLLSTAPEDLWQRFMAATFLRKTTVLYGLHELGLTRSRGLMILTRQES